MTSGIYVIQMSEDLVKVGRSEDMESRCRQHLRNARSVGLSPGSPVHVACSKGNLVRAERESHRRVRESGGVRSGGSPEVFSGVPLDVAVRAARGAVESVESPGCDHVWDWVVTVQGAGSSVRVWSPEGEWVASPNLSDSRLEARYPEEPAVVERCLSCGYVSMSSVTGGSWDDVSGLLYATLVDPGDRNEWWLSRV